MFALKKNIFLYICVPFLKRFEFIHLFVIMHMNSSAQQRFECQNRRWSYYVSYFILFMLPINRTTKINLFCKRKKIERKWRMAMRNRKILCAFILHIKNVCDRFKFNLLSSCVLSCICTCAYVTPVENIIIELFVTLTFSN